MKPLISIIIPVYNEEKVIADCLNSLAKQTYETIEIIVVDDGSTDNTIDIIKNCQLSIVNCQLLHQHHQGPGPARNLGAKSAKGEILVFVDADMAFHKDFVKNLVGPIIKGRTIGTFSKNEMVKNYDNIWSICWNINRNLPPDRMIPENYPQEAPVFRSILKRKFDEVGGFDSTGEYTDDWSLSRKLNIRSKAVERAIYYHNNPSSLKEVWQQARWIGKSEFISGTFLRRIRSLIQFFAPISLAVGFYKSFVNYRLLARRSAIEVGSFVIFKLIYDQAIFVSITKSFLGESKSK